ncbi:MSC_0622 family F1-like ATPase gamma subunit [Ureaplasma urealyticum]|uniref:F0F1 ATP synthase subunit gamma n=2 Tax=Ureaplasma urealyticum TaxID=2130 RepID=A0AAP9AC33_UREUR|nr:hypothetical protein [Ureaplasma urealyticum]EDX54196.1 conserved hypothetical protein [Ureaplasma urealyticum serovar 9 str. ATCC 33175]ACI60034.1 conserved hypothetical protein [Ureaplasma urealyticum serovar 10 str. ATCC 33699]EDT49716.1 conserved hypothetical protein [Ureaplasma urealyticum serovar 13 str. ATCC 33698]EDX53342.1 conserved hypothetical protein [Ureaplasma urealyticum serovar 12 str. ATCC 33696]EDY74559.1 conserved hypothetical protein [Ureaplasma urealyticum serovar 4 str
MQLKDLINKKKNLNNINLKVSNERNIFLINIMKLNQRLTFFSKNAFEIKESILSLKRIYNIKHDMLRHEERKIFKFLNKINDRVLWIYLTEEQKYSTDSYSRYEQKILETIKSNRDDFILIGQGAIEFGKNHNLNILQTFNDSNIKNLTTQLTKMIMILYTFDNYKKVNFVINSNKNYDGHFTILPMNEFSFDKFINLEKCDSNIIDFQKVKIYPNLNEFINVQINVFLVNIINTLITESSFYKTKNGLVATNNILKELDDNLSKIQRKITRVKTELQIEEINLLARQNMNEDDNDNDGGVYES